MPTVPLHPALVHVPLGLAFVLPLVAVALALAIWRGLLPRRAWLVAVTLQAVLVVASGAALSSGERDEGAVGRVTGRPAVEAHEHAAKAFVWGAGIVLTLAAAVLVLPLRAAVATAAIASAGTILVAALAYRAGEKGGDLVYARGGAAAFAPAPPPTPSTGVAAARPRKHHD